MSFDGMTDDALVKRMRFISDRLLEIKDKIEPIISEYEELSQEFFEIVDEMEERGLGGDVEA